jgi:hypothetical protein
VNYEISVNARGPRGLLQRLEANAVDLRPVLDDIADDFYQVERNLFRSRGGGKWRRLKPNTVRRKLTLGNARRPMVRTGDLEASLTRRGARGNVHEVDMDSLRVGTSLKQAVFHQRRRGGRRVIRVTRPTARRWARMVRDHLVAD